MFLELIHVEKGINASYRLPDVTKINDRESKAATKECAGIGVKV